MGRIRATAALEPPHLPGRSAPGRGPAARRLVSTVVFGLVLGLAVAGCRSGGTEAGRGDGGPALSRGATQTAAGTSAADGTLTLGTLLPRTGSLASLGPPELDAVTLAVQDIDAAGGVLGRPVRRLDADSGDTSTDTAVQSVDRLLGQGVDAVIGAASSGVSKTVIDKITAAGVVQMSAANTSPDFSTYPDRGLYFRTAPSDVLQGRVLGNLVVEDGNADVAVLAVQDAYGTGLANSVQKEVTGGHGTVVSKIVYRPDAPRFASEVAKIRAAHPDAVVLIGFAETAEIIRELVRQGIGPQQGTRLYLADGSLGQSSLARLPPGTLEGVKATMPGQPLPPGFGGRLRALDPKLAVLSYAAEAYDAVVLVALAAEEARSDAGVDIARHLVDVSRDGQRCTSFADCKRLVDAGVDIDYDGLSGPIDYDANGDVTQATIGIYTYDAAGSVPATAQQYRVGRP